MVAGDGGQGCEVPAFAGTTSFRRVNDVCNQCKGWGGDDAMGSCRTFGRFTNRPYIHAGNLPAFGGTTGFRRVDDVCNQCKGWGGVTQWAVVAGFGGCVWGGVTFGRFTNRPYIHAGNLPAFGGTTGFRRVDDVCNQCKGWGGDDAMGSCRWVWGVCLGWRDLRAVHEPPLHPRREPARLRRNDGISARG